MTLGRELKALNVVNNLGLFFMLTTLGCELRVQDVMDNLELWMT